MSNPRWERHQSRVRHFPNENLLPSLSHEYSSLLLLSPPTPLSPTVKIGKNCAISSSSSSSSSYHAYLLTCTQRSVQRPRWWDWEGEGKKSRSLDLSRGGGEGSKAWINFPLPSFPQGWTKKPWWKREERLGGGVELKLQEGKSTIQEISPFTSFQFCSFFVDSISACIICSAH